LARAKALGGVHGYAQEMCWATARASVRSTPLQCTCDERGTPAARSSAVSTVASG